MGKGQPVPPFVTACIQTLKQEGRTYSYIQESLKANGYTISISTISRIPIHGKRMKEPRGHRAALLTARDHRQVIRLIQKGEGRTLKEIQSKLCQKVSIATLSRAVQQNPEIIRQAPYTHPGLTAGHQEQRVI